MSDITEELKMPAKKQEYNAESIQVLEGLEAVRKRPAMYIGDISVRGLHHLVYEIVDNSIDEALAGFCKNVDVYINEDNSITVIDDGRGIPTDIMKKEGKSALEVIMTVLHAGGKFNKDTYKVSGGLHGVGASVVNALSEHFKVVVHKDGKVFQQEYKIGKPQYDVKKTGNTNKTGTEIHFLPDSTIFKVTEFKFDTLAARLRELAFLNKGIKLNLTDMRDVDDKGKPHKETYFSEGGLKEFVKYLDGTRPSILPEPISIEGEKENVIIEIALTYNQDFNENVHSYVNNINTIEGGAHVSGFRKAMTRVFKSYGEKNGLFTKLNFEVTGDDFREGLTAVISAKVPEPQFEGQTKSKLGNSEVVGITESIVNEVLSYYLEEHPKEAKNLINKVILTATARNAARKARELVQRKNGLGGSGLPGKLADCSDTDAERCELYLVEGDSAGGTAKQGRSRKFQAILPLRGKILNVEKAMEHKIYENEEIKNIFTAIGVSVGTTEDNKALNLDKLRYHKIIIMTDADVDGSHISTLILTFFFRYMKELIERGYVYLAAPPLYLVKKVKNKHTPGMKKAAKKPKKH